MAWYYGTYSCGHEGRVNIVGPTKDRQWKADREFSVKCKECWKKDLEEKRKAENEKSMSIAKELDLPELEGTEKQVAWANTLRLRMLEEIDEILERIESKKRVSSSICHFSADDVRTIKYHIMSKTKASFFIEKRNDIAQEILLMESKEALKAEEEREKEKEEKMIFDEITAESTIRPENPVTETVVEIYAEENKVIIKFPERLDSFRKIMKEDLKMTWEGRWERNLIYRNGSPADRAAEAGHILLSKGFVVRIKDSEIRKKAILGNYEPEKTRWIVALSGKNEGKLGIVWDRKCEDFYRVARRLPGSKYDSPYVVVPREQYDEIVDFANMYDFSIYKRAKELIELAKKEREMALVVNIKEKQKIKFVADDIPKKLEVPEEIGVDEEFLDYD